MRNFILSADAGCDLSAELCEKYDVKILPLRYMVGDEEYSSDDGRMPAEKICEHMLAGDRTSTSQANPEEAEKYMRSLLDSGKDVIHVTMSSAMSGTYETMRKIAERLNAEYENKIYVVDSLCQCGGYGLLLILVADKAEEENFDAEQAKDYAEKIRLNVIHNFSVDSLTYLARGGRIPSYLATIGNLIKLKPVLHVDDDGKIVMLKKIIGRRRALDDVAARFAATYNGASKKVIICQAICPSDAEYVKDKIIALYPDLNVTILPLGPIIVSHSGPGTLALFFTADSRKD